MEGNKCLLSIIIPVYNTQEYLERCLNSVILNSSDSFEVIIVNDGSTDNSKEICETFVSLYPQRFRLFNKKNGGLSSARNYAIRQNINGEYILFLDSDDYLEKGFLDRICNILHKKDNIDLYEYGYVIHEYGKKDKVVEPIAISDKKSFVKGEEYLKQVLQEKGFYEWYAWKYIIKREFLIETGLFLEGRNYEDVLLMPKLIGRCRSICTLPYVGYHYILGRPGAITQGVKLQNEIDKLYAASEGIKLFEETKDEKLKILAQDNFAKLYYSALTSLYMERERKKRKDLEKELLRHKDMIKYTFSGKQKILKNIIKICGIHICGYLLYIRAVYKNR